MENTKEVMITMGKEELDKIVYNAAKGACDNLFRGLYPFFDRLQEDNRTLIEQMEQLKLRMGKGE